MDSTPGWPAPAESLERARQFLRSAPAPLVLACDRDVDGLTSAVIVARTLERSRPEAPIVMPIRRGEHVHLDSMRERIRAAAARSLVVLDMGSRPGPIVPGLPTLVIDHHDASAGTPDGAEVVNGYDRPPVATTSMLAFTVCREMADIADLEWVAALGAVADLGSLSAFPGFFRVRAGGRGWTAAVSLLNAARRAGADDTATALQVLDAARSVHDITDGPLEGIERLKRYQEEVRQEVARCSRVPPKVAGEVALIRFSSPAQVHPVVATRWTRRLSGQIVIAANDGYLPGRVNFAIRTSRDVDLLRWLRSLPFTPTEGEFANGHSRATGGSLTPEDFAKLLSVLGFTSRPPGKATVERIPRSV